MIYILGFHHEDPNEGDYVGYAGFNIKYRIQKD